MKRANQIIEVNFSRSRKQAECGLAVANGHAEVMELRQNEKDKPINSIEQNEIEGRRARAKYAASKCQGHKYNECTEVEDFGAKARRESAMYAASRSPECNEGHEDVYAKERRERAMYAASKRRVESVQPLKDEQSVQKVINYLKTTGKYALRNWLLFVIGISTGLRCSDIVVLTFGHFFESNGMLKDVVVFNEKKTGKKKVYNINDQLREALFAYVEALPSGYKLDEYIFYSNKKSSAHLQVDTVRRVIVKAVEKAINDDIRKENEDASNDENSMSASNNRASYVSNSDHRSDCGATYPKRKKPLVHVGSHTMRKTYALRALKTAEANKELNPFSPAPLTVVQGLLNHSSELMTLRYLGIDIEARKEVERNMYRYLSF